MTDLDEASSEKTKFFRSVTLVTPALENGTSFFENENPVEVISETGNRLGWCSLHWRDTNWSDPDPLRREIVAELVLTYSSPERLEVEQGVEYFASLFGVSTFPSGENYAGPIRFPNDFTDIFVTYVVVSKKKAFENQPHLGEFFL